jgi:hypothetical protein
MRVDSLIFVESGEFDVLVDIASIKEGGTGRGFLERDFRRVGVTFEHGRYNI